ncbi:MAG TPA: LCP family protein, partial [Pseudolysinimonas sp.]|nr:LCP family protein [Pseudolysinimonas sp.]
PYAAEISFDGVAAMSNAVGGVTVCTANSINDPATGLVLPAGENTIQGATALAFVRTRHGVGDGSDLGRISNQQVFLSALARKIASEGVLKNPLELYGIAKAAASNMELSDSLGHLDTMVAIALALKNIPLQNIVMVQYPVASAPSDPNRVVPAVANATVLNKALQNDQPIQLTGQLGRAAVVDTNPTAPSPSASAVKAKDHETLSRTPSPAPTQPPTQTVVQLPSSVVGQNAAQQTCSKGNGR